MVIRFFIEGYMDLLLCSLINLFQLDYSNWTNGFCSVFSMIMVGMCVVTPVFLLVFTLSRLHLIGTPTYHSRIGSMYEDLEIQGALTALFHFFFVFRRLFLVLTLIYCQDFVWIQIQGLTLQVLLMVIYVLYWRPFSLQSNNTGEAFNEFTILLCCYHLPVFTDFVDDSGIQYNGGWSIMTCVILNMAVNFFKMIMASIYTLIAQFKRRWPKIRAWYYKKFGNKYSSYKYRVKKVPARQQSYSQLMSSLTMQSTLYNLKNTNSSLNVDILSHEQSDKKEQELSNEHNINDENSNNNINAEQYDSNQIDDSHQYTNNEGSINLQNSYQAVFLGCFGNNQIQIMDDFTLGDSLDQKDQTMNLPPKVPSQLKKKKLNKSKFQSSKHIKDRFGQTEIDVLKKTHTQILPGVDEYQRKGSFLGITVSDQNESDLVSKQIQEVNEEVVIQNDDQQDNQVADIKPQKRTMTGRGQSLNVSVHNSITLLE